jgi:hypothetical protein
VTDDFYRRTGSPCRGLPGTLERLTHAVASSRPRATAYATKAAFWWAVAFTALHVYWFLGGRVGFGDQPDPLPGWPSSLGGWVYTIGVWGIFAAGLVVPIAFTTSWGGRFPRRLLVWLMWTGGAVLLLRGGVGWVDDVLRFGGLVDGGLTGLSSKEVFGSAHPSAYTRLSTVAIDSIFVSGGIIFGYAATLGGKVAKSCRFEPARDEQNRRGLVERGSLGCASKPELCRQKL